MIHDHRAVGHQQTRAINYDDISVCCDFECDVRRDHHVSFQRSSFPSNPSRIVVDWLQVLADRPFVIEHTFVLDAAQGSVVTELTVGIDNTLVGIHDE